MAKWIEQTGVLLTKQDAADVAWLIELALPHVTLNAWTKRRLSAIKTRIRNDGA